MIFVTVGTHEQQFNRLIKEIDYLKANGDIREDVIIQTGYSDYIPVHCTWSSFIKFDEMKEYISKARVVITHGGPASFMEVLSSGKIPIVVPRLKDFEEHVNNHQLEFVKKVKEKGYNISLVEEIGDLQSEIANYETNLNHSLLENHNKEFVTEFIKIVKL